MPWDSRHAFKYTRKAKTPRLKTAWRKAANAALKHYGDESIAVRVANSVINRMSGGTGRDPIKPRSKSATIKRKGRPGRKPGFKHSATTKRKMSAAHRARHRKVKRKVGRPRKRA
jgi:hypothetical protein